PLALAGLPSHLLELAAAGGPPLGGIGFVALGDVQVRRLAASRRERLKARLRGDQVVKIPAGEATGAEQLRGVNLRPRAGDHAVIVREFPPHRLADVQRPALEGKKANRV